MSEARREREWLEGGSEREWLESGSADEGAVEAAARRMEALREEDGDDATMADLARAALDAALPIIRREAEQLVWKMGEQLASARAEERDRIVKALREQHVKGADWDLHEAAEFIESRCGLASVPAMDQKVDLVYVVTVGPDDAPSVLGVFSSERAAVEAARTHQGGSHWQVDAYKLDAAEFGKPVVWTEYDIHSRKIVERRGKSGPGR